MIRCLRTLSILFFCALLSFAWRRAGVTLERGPYLQSPAPEALTLVCQTSASAGLTLRYGERAGPPWQGERSSPAGTTHVFALSGLRPETRYVYELAASGVTLASGPACAFRTSPPAESRAPFRFLAWGDSGTGNQGQRDVAAQMERVFPAAEFALGLGDLVYDSGAWADYDPKLFTPYATLFRHTPFWPALGNHDAETENGAPYLDAFYLPTTSGASGHPSNTERYYSFDHGMAHFACLDSQTSSSTPGGAMYAWLEDDLDQARARGKRWLIVFMHHPPYSRGTHDSTSESDLITLHANLVPLFGAEGVDLVLTGHSHVYERSFLAKNDAILQANVSEYTKIGSPDGTVYLVTGCGGESGTGPLDHPLMARGYGNVYGFNLFDVSHEELRGRFVERDGRTTDLFTLHKAADTRAPRVRAVQPRGASELALAFDEPLRAGTGAGGAEDPGRYTLSPSGAVLAAALDSDQSTVRLTTSSLAENRGYTLGVHGVGDPAGHSGDQLLRFALGTGGGVTPTLAVPRGSSWRYRDGASPPPAGWKDNGFDASGWSLGPAGFGYADGDDATVVSGMQGVYATLYTRTTFQLGTPAPVLTLVLNASYDDGFVAYLNGVELVRANVPAGQSNTTFASGGHEAGTFEAFDASTLRSLLVAGTNVLAVEGHNASLSSNDFSLHPELVLGLDTGSGPPTAVIEAPVHTANAPARLRFSGAGSSDEDGPLALFSWDFGDGGPQAQGPTVEHVYTSAGLFTVTLLVRDGDGLEAVAESEVRIHEQGDAPQAALDVSATNVQPGASVAFDGRGSRDPDGGTLSFHWDFGEPGSGVLDVASSATASHAYAAAGTYVATLVVTDDEGSSATDEVTITAGLAGAPSALFAATASGLDPLSILFDDRSTGDIDAWSWDFGDGASSSEQEPEHLYAAEGRYTVVLTVSGPNGSDAYEHVVSVGLTSGGSGGGGGCSIAPDDGRPRGGDPLLAATLVVTLLLLARPRRARPDALRAL